ncbi:MAG: acyl carrier protein [Clostridia bacterium]|nr:acyl carrier protein [Clostridia bacterium]
MYDKVKELLINELSVNPDDIKPEAELESDLGINSLELADLVFLCEEKFSIQIDDDDYKKLITVGDVVKYLEDASANA